MKLWSIIAKTFKDTSGQLQLVDKGSTATIS